MRFDALGRVPHALAIAGMVSSMGAASAWGAAGDNGQYFMIEGLYLAKDDGDTIDFTASDDGDLFKPVTDDVIELDGTGGARATAQFAAFGHTWQASAFGVVSFDQDFFVADLNSGLNSTSTTYAEFDEVELGDANDPSNSDNMHALDLSIEAELWGAEFSWIKNLQNHGFKNVDLLVGVRYLHYGEALSSVAFKNATDLPGGGGNEIDRVGIDVGNNLLGLQVGLQAMWEVADCISVGGSLKGGIAANFVSRDRSFSADDGPGDIPDFANSHDDTGFAQFVEVNPRVDIELSETATLTIGGTVLWINETSRAAAHYQTAADATDSNLRDDDDELLYGASIGLKLALN